MQAVRDAVDLWFTSVSVTKNKHTNTVWNRLHMNLYTMLCKQWYTAVCKLSENQFSVVNINRRDVYANVIIKVIGSRINKY